MKKRLLVSLLFFSINAFAQNPEFNHEKYWYLRWRLKNYFIVVGEGLGMSLPAECRNDVAYPVAGFEYDDGDLVQIRFGDDPNFLGLYIGVLATEYKLLSENNQNTYPTLVELYYAIKAINRLDEFESEYPFFLTNQLDGRCSRGDVFPDFVPAHFAELNKSLNNFHPSLSNGDPTEVKIGSTGRLDVGLETVPGAYELFKEASKDGSCMSQDHISSIFVGLALVKKFVPGSLSINGMYFVNESQNIVHRIMGYMMDCNWYLKRPDGVPISGAKGGYAYAYAYGFAKAAAYIDPTHSVAYLGNVGAQTWHPFWEEIGGSYLSITDFNQFLINHSLPHLGVEPSARNAWIPLNLACVGNSWETAPAASILLPNPIFAPFAVSIVAACATPVVECTNSIIWLHSRVFEWQAFFPLLHAVLHNATCFTGSDKIEEDLNSMPCSGPWNHNFFFRSQGWASSSLKYHSSPDENENCIYGYKGEHSGLDYMLLFNLHCIHQQGNYLQLSKYQNLMNGGDMLSNYPASEFLLPPPSSMKYTSGANPVSGLNAIIQPATVGSFENIYSTSNIHGGNTLVWENIGTNLQAPLVVPLTANVTFRAGNEIELGPGFEVGYNAEFEAYIDPYECNPSGNAYQRLAGNSTDINQSSSTQIRQPIPDLPTTISDNSIFLIPNPTTGKFTIVLNIETPIQDRGDLAMKVEIFSVLGEKVYTSSAPLSYWREEGGEVDLSAQPSGIYFVKVQTAEKIFTRKLVIQ